MNIDYVLQENNFDCGIAALQTVFLQFGKRISKEDITTKNINQGITALELINASKRLGIDAKGVKSDLFYLDSNFLPAIAHVIKDKSYFHYLVILKNNKVAKTITVMDPAVGVINMTYEEFNKITTSIFLIFNKKKIKTTRDLRFKKFIIELLKQNKKLVFITIIISFLLIILSLIFSYYLKLILEYQNIYIKITICFLIVALTKNIISFFRNKFIVKLSINIDKKITHDFINQMFFLPNKYYLNKTTGELINLASDVENFKDIIIKFFIVCFVDLLFLIIIMLYSFFINYYYLLIYLILFLITICLTFRYQHLYKNNYVKLKNSKINSSSLLIESFEGYNSIKNLAIEDNIIKNNIKNNKNVLENNKSYNYINNNYNFINDLILEIFYILIIFTSIYLNLNNNLSILNVILFGSIFNLYTSFLTDMNQNLVMFKLYNTSIVKVLDLFDIKKEEENQEFSFNNIKYNDVTFKYGNKTILEKINFTINKKDKIFISGKSGIGKSTLIKLLLKYEDITKGNIFIDNIDLKYITLKNLRRNITYVSQDEKIFNDTIYNNLKIVCDDEEKIQKVIKICEIDKILKGNNIDMNYFVYENGKNLSGGEKKKIFIARALLKGSSTIIFDESFNEIDLKTERRILKNIMKYYKDITIIFISHRLNNKDLFNKKYKLEEKTLKEE